MLGTAALLEWHSYRDSSKFVNHRKTNWEAAIDDNWVVKERYPLQRARRATAGVTGH